MLSCTNSHSYHGSLGGSPRPPGRALPHTHTFSATFHPHHQAGQASVNPAPRQQAACTDLPRRKPTSISSALSHHPGPLLLRIELLLYEEGAAHIHVAARGLAVLGAGHSLFFRWRVWGLRPPTASGFFQPCGQLGGDIEILFGLSPRLLGAASTARIPRRKRPAQTEARCATVQVIGVAKTPVVHTHRVLPVAQPVPAPLRGGIRWHGHAGCPRRPHCRLPGLDGVQELPLSAVPIAHFVTDRTPRWRWPGTLLLQEVFGELEENELC